MSTNHGGVRVGAGRPAVGGVGCERRTISIRIGDWEIWGATAHHENQSLSEWLRNLANKQVRKVGLVPLPKQKRHKVRKGSE